MNNRVRAEGLLLWALIIATPLVLIWGSRITKAKLSDYWQYIFIYLCISGVLWAGVWLFERFFAWQEKRRKQDDKPKIAANPMPIPTPIPAGVDPKLHTACQELMWFSNDLFGAYLDALAGLEQIRQELINRQRVRIAELKNTQPDKASEEFMDQQGLEHWFPADQSGPEEPLHWGTQGEFKRRTAPGGLDARFLSQMMVALLYGAWEDRYRERVALSLGHSEKDALGSDLFQDICKLRHAIVHNQGRATEDVEHAKIIRWFRRGDEIYISPERAQRLLYEIAHYLGQLCGVQPDEVQGN